MQSYRKGVAEYLAAMANDLAKIADEQGFSTLTYILKMANEQASLDVARQKTAAPENCDSA